MLSCPARPSQSPQRPAADSCLGRVATHPGTEEVRAREGVSEPIMLPILRTREGVRTRTREGASEPIRRRRSPRAGLRSVPTPSALPLSGPAALPRSRVDPVDGEPCCGPYAAATGRSCSTAATCPVLSLPVRAPSRRASQAAVAGRLIPEPARCVRLPDLLRRHGLQARNCAGGEGPRECRKTALGGVRG